MKWHEWLETLDLAGLLPGLRDSKGLLRQGLEDFLTRLSLVRQGELWRALEPYFPLPVEAQIFVLLRSCPTLHKLGQSLSRDRRLPPAVRFQLERLESLPPSTAVELPAELRPGAPLAEGSLAVVVAVAEGVAKVLKPGVVERLEEELSVLALVAEGLSLAQREVLESVATLLRAEVDLRAERGNLERAGKEGLVRVPAVGSVSTPEFFTMERLDSVPLTGGFALAHELWTNLVGGVVFAPGPRLVHLDPHPGNLRLGLDGKLVVLDWSLTCELSDDWRRGLVQLALARQLGLPELAREGLELLLGGPARPEWVDLSRSLPAALDGVPASLMPPALLLWRKSLHTLEQLTAQLSPALDPEAALAECCLQALCREAPWRLLNYNFGGPLSQISNQLIRATMLQPLRGWS